MQPASSMQIITVPSKPQGISRSHGGTKPDSLLAPKQWMVMAPWGMEMGQSPDFKTANLKPTYFLWSLSSHSFPRRDCKNLPTSPVRHIKQFNCLWRLLSHLTVPE